MTSLAVPLKVVTRGRNSSAENSPTLASVGSRLTARTRPFAMQRANATESETSGADTWSSGVKHDFADLQIYPRANLPIQAKLIVSQPNDSLEREADRIADVVMRMPESPLRRGPVSHRQKARQEAASDLVQAKSAAVTAPITAPPIVNEVLNSAGQSLDAQSRGAMEQRFGHDFSRVRVHADTRAAESARAVDALAYTVGKSIVFGAGQFQPNSMHGQRLLAHELAHVVQQSGVPHPSELQRWAISGDTATADKQGDMLGPLAQEVGANFQDWKCIRPLHMKLADSNARPADFAERYDRYILIGDRFDVSNLKKETGPALQIHLFDAKNLYAAVTAKFYPGVGGTKDPAATIGEGAHWGRTPLASLVIVGHAHEGTMFGDATVFTPRVTDPEKPQQTFADAEMGISPQRCWFTRNAAVRAVGCDSEAWGQDFARHFLRVGATVTATVAPVRGTCSGKTPELIAIAGRCRALDGFEFASSFLSHGVTLEGPFRSAAEFHAGTYWAEIAGKL